MLSASLFFLPFGKPENAWVARFFLPFFSPFAGWRVVKSSFPVSFFLETFFLLFLFLPFFSVPLVGLES